MFAVVVRRGRSNFRLSNGGGNSDAEFAGSVVDSLYGGLVCTGERAQICSRRTPADTVERTGHERRAAVNFRTPKTHPKCTPHRLKCSSTRVLRGQLCKRRVYTNHPVAGPLSRGHTFARCVAVVVVVVVVVARNYRLILSFAIAWRVETRR